MTEPSAEPLYKIIRKLRKPATLRELMAACLRSIYMGDPLTRNDGAIPETPKYLIEEVSVTTHILAGIRCAVYTPVTRSPKMPLMLYMHGGGFVIGCSEDTDYTTRMLCHANQMIVVSVNYRLAPETIFPGALTDCEQVLDAALLLASESGIENSPIYLAGDSAGANLAFALYYKLQKHKSSIKGLILFAPWLDMEVEKYNSYNRLAPTGVVFDAAFLGYARGAYVGFEQWKNPLVSPLFSALSELPPTLVIVGTEDPFLDQVLELKQKAIDSGNKQIEFEIYPGMPHCFYSLPSIFSEEKECYKRIAEFIQSTN